MTKILIDEAVVRQAMEDFVVIKYGLEKSRIWGGVDWTYNPIHPVHYLPLRDKAEARMESLNQALAEAALDKKADNARELGLDYEQPAPAHCEAGPEYCQQCCKESFEDRSLALAAAVRYVKNNTPNLVWTEIERALTTPPAPAQPLTDANKQFNAAINFAIDQGIEAAVFLAAWREGDTVEWPEFDSYIAAHGITKGN